MMINNKLENILSLLRASKNKIDLNLFIVKLYDLVQDDEFNKSINLDSNNADNQINLALVHLILTEFADRVCNFIFAKGDIIEREYIILFRLFLILEKFNYPYNLNKKNIELLQSIEYLSINNFLKLSEDENLMLLELGVLSKMLQGRATEAIEYYIFGILHFNLNKNYSVKLASFILQNFDLLRIDFSIIENAIKRAIQKEHFFSLDKQTQRSIFNWQIHTLWNLKNFFNLKDWLNLYPVWKNILYEYIFLKDIDCVLYTQFFIYHMCGNSYENTHHWTQFNNEISRQTTKLYIKYLSENAKSSPLEKLKINLVRDSKKEINIAILKDRLVLNSPYKVEYSLLKNYLNINGKYKVNFRIYLMSFIEKSENDSSLIEELNKIGVSVIDVVSKENQARYYNSHLKKALLLYDAIKLDNIDILISPNNGYGISDFLMCSDCARHKVFYSHGNFAYDIGGIDSRLTHICGGQKYINHNGFEFHGVSVKMDNNFYNPPVNAGLIKNIKNKLNVNHKLIFGTIGRLVKIDSLDYLKTIIKIMKKTDSIYLCCGIGNENSIIEKIKKIDENILNRFRFLGYVDSGVYGHIIDFWPDSFPMQQGESRIEFSSKNGLNLVLSVESRSIRASRITTLVENNMSVLKNLNMQKSEILAILMDESFTAFDIAEYEDKFLNLIEKKEALKTLLEKQNNILELIKEYNSKIMFDLFLDSIALLDSHS